MKKQWLLTGVTVLCLLGITGCSTEVAENEELSGPVVEKDIPEDEAVELSAGEVILEAPPTVDGLEYEKSLDLEYAQSFTLDYFKGGYGLATIGGRDRYLLVPEGQTAPAGLDADIAVIQKPLKGFYIATTPAMSLVNALGRLDAVSFCGTEADKWSIKAIREAVAAGSIQYAGKYKEPDYEMLVAAGTNLAIQSAMIESVPEVVNKFDELGIPVLIDRGSEESHPLGKVEWVKFYAALTDTDMSVANALFDAQKEVVETLSAGEKIDKSVAIFFITSKGKLYVRNDDDYVTKMVELAGGTYIFDALENSGTNSTTMEMEAFYAAAKDADYILYMYSTGGKPEMLADLVEKNALIEDFAAVKSGNVWATCPEFFQINDRLGNMIGDLHTMLTSDESTPDRLDYVFKLK
ncbi:ABC transporter substrate-binding protein [Fusibacter sp. JL298sf-3]